MVSNPPVLKPARRYQRVEGWRVKGQGHRPHGERRSQESGSVWCKNVNVSPLLSFTSIINSGLLLCLNDIFFYNYQHLFLCLNDSHHVIFYYNYQHLFLCLNDSHFFQRYANVRQGRQNNGFTTTATVFAWYMQILSYSVKTHACSFPLYRGQPRQNTHVPSLSIEVNHGGCAV